MQARLTPQATRTRELETGLLELLGRIGDDLAHEINNPLHASVINLEVLRSRIAGGRTDEALARVDVIQTEIRRLQSMTDHLLALLRSDSKGARSVDVDQVVDELAPLLELRARLARCDFSYNAAGNAGTVDVRPDALRFAVLITAEPVLDVLRGGGGRLELSTDGLESEARIHIRAHAPIPAEPDASDRGISFSPDSYGAPVAMAAELVRDSGGRVLLGPHVDGSSASSAPELIVLIPRVKHD